MEQVAQYIAVAEEIMSEKVRIMVPRLIKERGLSPLELMYGTRIAPGTAYTLADEEKSQKMTAISFDVLLRLCQFFGVGPGDILEIVTVEGEGSESQARD